MARVSSYQSELDYTADVLRTPRTARELGEILDLCKPAAYARLEKLIAAGKVEIKGQVRDGSKGPQATLYGIRGAVAAD